MCFGAAGRGPSAARLRVDCLKRPGFFAKVSHRHPAGKALSFEVRQSVRVCLTTLLIGACASEPETHRYRFLDTGPGWSSGKYDPVIAELRPRYPGYFKIVLDPASVVDPDLRPLRRDLEKHPVDRENFDALNAVAIGYFEMNARIGADSENGAAGGTYFADSFRTAQLIAVPSRAYGEILNPQLRDAILDFFEDIAAGQKPGTRVAGTRLARTLASLELQETDPERKARIRQIAAQLRNSRARPERPRTLVWVRKAPSPSNRRAGHEHGS